MPFLTVVLSLGAGWDMEEKKERWWLLYEDNCNMEEAACGEGYRLISNENSYTLMGSDRGEVGEEMPLRAMINEINVTVGKWSGPIEKRGCKKNENTKVAISVA